jgi:hypothetical protein
VAVLALVTGGCKEDSGASTPKEAGTAAGEVVRARYDGVVLKQQGSDTQLRLTVDPSTQVVMDGRFVMVERLPEGTPVRATYDASGKATRIEALPKGGASGGGQTRLESSADTGGLGGSSSNTPGQAGGTTTGPAAPHASDPGAPRGSSETGAAGKK